jgi:hypothetical protein
MTGFIGWFLIWEFEGDGGSGLGRVKWAGWGGVGHVAENKG